MGYRKLGVSLWGMLASATLLWAQDPNSAATMKVQQEKLAALAMLDGTWRGEAWMLTPSGERIELVQTERVGPMLDGTVRVVEGLGYDNAGNVAYNALGIISYDAQSKKYLLRSYTQGRQGDFDVEVQNDELTWSIKTGGATIRYRATIRDGKWIEVGERLVGNQPPFKFMELNLTRIGDTKWPVEGTVPPK